MPGSKGISLSKGQKQRIVNLPLARPQNLDGADLLLAVISTISIQRETAHHIGRHLEQS
jgi:hypothetical protein